MFGSLPPREERNPWRAYMAQFYTAEQLDEQEAMYARWRAWTCSEEGRAWEEEHAPPPQRPRRGRKPR